MRNLGRYSARKLFIFAGACIIGTGLVSLQALNDIDNASWSNHRQLQLDLFLKNVIEPFFRAIKMKFPGGIDMGGFFDSPNSDGTNEMNQIDDISNPSAPGGDDADDTEAISNSDSSEKVGSVFSTSCSEPTVFILQLTSKGALKTESELFFTVKDYSICFESYQSFGNFSRPFVSVIKTEDRDDPMNAFIEVSCCDDPNTPGGCVNLQDNFLNENQLCNDAHESGFYVPQDSEPDLFQMCSEGASQSSSQTLVLPQEYMMDLTPIAIESSLNEFLNCRLHMGAYDDLTSRDFPSFSGFDTHDPREINPSYQQGDIQNVTLTCTDDCFGAFCNDILKHYTTELTCVTKHVCSDEYSSDFIDIAFIEYELEFLTEPGFEIISQEYGKDLEHRTAMNLENYIFCRFEEDQSQNFNDFYGVKGKMKENKFKGRCGSNCGSAPFCDTLRIPRKADSMHDMCYERFIRTGENERVVTSFDYNLDYRDINGNAQSFSYSTQSVSTNPVARQYYGSLSQTLPALTQTQLQTQNSDLQDLMGDFGFNEPSHKFENPCDDLTDHITCETNNRIVKIDMEIPNGNGFKAPDIKNKFGDHLEGLTLGITLNEAKNFPERFFEMTNLKQLTIRPKGKMKGSLPTTIGDMTNLKNLDLNQCPKLASNHEGLTGSIPTEIQSTPLNLVDLGCNQITGSIPSQFYKKENGSFKNYKVIALNENALTGTISNSINQLHNLRQLSMANNSLTGGFPNMNALDKLKLLDLRGNRDSNGDCTDATSASDKGFTGSLPNLLKTEGSRLVAVALNDNCFSGTVFNQIDRLSDLQYLNLMNNNLSGTIPSNLKELTNLRYLFLQGNPNLNYQVPGALRTFLDDNSVTHDLY